MICLLFTAVTTTDTTGSWMYFFSFSVMVAVSCIGVRPAACISPISAIEIIPSGRTGNVPESVASFHTCTDSPSSAPIM